LCLDFRQKKASDQAGLSFLAESGRVGGHFSVMSDQRNQGVLLTMGELAEALQQFPFVQGKLRAIQAHAQLFSQCAFLNKTLLKARNDFGVHAAMMIASHLGNAFRLADVRRTCQPYGWNKLPVSMGAYI
jgi:hypothetical protein